jgi:hypothetical protein
MPQAVHAVGRARSPASMASMRPSTPSPPGPTASCTISGGREVVGCRRSATRARCRARCQLGAVGGAVARRSDRRRRARCRRGRWVVGRAVVGLSAGPSSSLSAGRRRGRRARMPPACRPVPPACGGTCRPVPPACRPVPPACMPAPARATCMPPACSPVPAACRGTHASLWTLEARRSASTESVDAGGAEVGVRPDHGARTCTRIRRTPSRPWRSRVHANPVDAAPTMALARARESGGRRSDHGAGACTRIRWTPPHCSRVHANPVDAPTTALACARDSGGRSSRVHVTAVEQRPRACTSHAYARILHSVRSAIRYEPYQLASLRAMSLIQ